MARPLLCASSAVAILTFSASLAAGAATPGIAFDSVTKVAAGESTSEPGSFAADFASASAATPPGGGKRGFLGLGAAIAAASGAMAMFKTGTAERHYIAGAKHRIDSVASGTARITDCSARTLTTLDLAKKTYTIVSLDQPTPTAGPARPHEDREPRAVATDDGTKFSLVLANKSLGARSIDGIATNGYDAHMTMTTTNRTGETHAFESDMTSYVSSYAEPRESCAEMRVGTGIAGPRTASMAPMLMALGAMKTPGGDPRFTVKSSGAPLPAGRLAIWQHMAMQGGPGFGMLIERGNVRSITDADPVFGIPAGFTKTN